MILEKDIGKKIRELRSLKGMTLDVLAEKTGFTKGYLSRVENSEKAPPVSTLIKIAKALQVDLSEILSEMGGSNTVSLVRKNERVVMARDGSVFGYYYESLAHKFTNKNMEPYIITVPTNPKEVPHFKHKGEEVLLVLEGKMKFIHGDREFILEEGDCIYFDSDIEHSSAVIGPNDCKCMMVIYSPS
jgi:transcriptional regulator with XRE-family HTH domain